MYRMDRYIGCSGYHYPEWKNSFYPQDLPKKKWLEYYAGHFNTVEINNTFYKMPDEGDLERWKKASPGHFKFTIKGNRYFTHMKKLNMDKDFTGRFDTFLDTLNILGEKLGCVLWQLPGNLHKDLSKLETFCKSLDNGLNHVIEFRHPSWFNDSVYRRLSDAGVSFCMISSPAQLPEEPKFTNKTAYMRFHGKSTWYNYRYSEDELKEWKIKLDQTGDLDNLFVYFNNDQHAYAVENARYMRSLFGD